LKAPVHVRFLKKGQNQPSNLGRTIVKPFFGWETISGDRRFEEVKLGVESEKNHGSSRAWPGERGIRRRFQMTPRTAGF